MSLQEQPEELGTTVYDPFTIVCGGCLLWAEFLGLELFDTAPVEGLHDMLTQQLGATTADFC